MITFRASWIFIQDILTLLLQDKSQLNTKTILLNIGDKSSETLIIYLTIMILSSTNKMKLENMRLNSSIRVTT